MIKKIDINKTSGFTLTELMIVILIMGLIAVFSVPGYNQFMQTWKLNGEAQEFASMLRTARSAAVMKNIPVVFNFNMANNTYSYFEDNDGDGSHDAGEYRSEVRELVPGVVITAHTLPSQVLTFGRKGDTGSGGAITLRNVKNRTRIVRVFGGTGNIKVD